MLTVGQGLYQLTERDNATLYVDSYFRAATVSIAAGTAAGSVDLAIPIDRCLFLHSFLIKGDPTPLSTWNSFKLNLTSNDGTTVYQIYADTNEAGLNSDNGAAAAGSTCTIYRPISLMLPPSVSKITYLAQRAVTTNAATATINLMGYLIPPGRFGRIA